MLKGNITISRPSGTDAHGNAIKYIQIGFEDESSGTRFLRATLSYEDFALALTGHSFTPCEFRLTADKVGLIRQHKREPVFMADGEWATRDERAAEAVKVLEVDGWTGRAQNALNHHRLVKREGRGAWYSVLFDRYVEPDEAPNPN